jgi:hypothetical protein
LFNILSSCLQEGDEVGLIFMLYVKCLTWNLFLFKNTRW